MADDVLRIERREHIAILTLNRPDRLNALSVELREALTSACQELRDDDNVLGRGPHRCWTRLLLWRRFAHTAC
jgi:enoyl-CoA hydratase/carnithine racemase